MRTSKTVSLLLIIMIMAWATGNALAAENAASELLNSVIEQRRATTEKNDIVMTLIDGSGKKWPRTGKFYMTRKDKDNDMMLFHFYTPAELAKSGILTVENSSGVHDQWLYLPAYHTTRRIAGGNRKEKYMGTDFFYEDIIRIRVKEYTIREVGKEVKNGVSCVVIEGAPSSARLKDESAYAKIVWWIDPKKKVMLGAKYYDKKGTLLKTLDNSGLQTIKGYHIWGKQTMTDVQNNHKTVLELRNTEVDEPIPADIFSMRYLKRAQ